MPTSESEIKRREKEALAAIKNAFGTPEDEYGATLFVHHHLEEVEESYWQKHLGIARPEPRSVLDILALHKHWGDEGSDGMDNFDFTLPDEITDYLICVHFNKSGQVKKITMES